MASTSAFGWETPDDTDLVKDGAAAIRTLGNSIDTSMSELKGGTTGQVLSKTSNTDMDFTWVAQDDSNAIQNAIVDAKGDLIAASANDTPARLAVGNNGETLVADSSTSTGLRYTAGTVQANPVLNSAFQIWQRGTSFALGSSGGAYTADRWTFLNPGTGNFTISRQTTGDTTNLANVQYCLRLQRNSGQTATTVNYLTSSMETINSIPFAGKTITFSFYARAGANYSAASSILSLNVSSGTGTDQNINSSFTGLATVISQNSTITTTWQRFTYTGSVASTATQLGFYFNWTPAGTAGANDYFEVTGVQIDIGSVALPFRTYAGTIQGELAACQRYYYRFGGSANYQYYGVGVGASSTVASIQIVAPVTMRTSPTSIDSSTLGLSDSVGGIISVTSVTADVLAPNVQSVAANVASGLTQYRFYRLFSNNSTSAYIGFSAEL